MMTTPFREFSAAERRALFDGEKVSARLPYPAAPDESDARGFPGGDAAFSFSGAQRKFSMRVIGRNLRFTPKGEFGTHILKPVPARFKNREDVPANEALTMTIFSKIFKIRTAACGLCFFGNGAPAYLTRRFDVLPDGSRLRMEDFASLAGKSAAEGGSAFKYDCSCEEMAELIRRHVPAWKIEIETFFRVVVLNYLFSNGDAHLKNFALLENSFGDMSLAPIYDVLDTSLHVADEPFALKRGLFSEERITGKAAGTHFLRWAEKIGIPLPRAAAQLAAILAQEEAVLSEIGKSRLSDSAKTAYERHFRTRRNLLGKRQ